MGKFSYKVRDGEDRVLLGTMEAISADEVLERLNQKNLLPILVKELIGDELRTGKTFAEKLTESLTQTKNKVPYKSVVFFTRQLATMVGQGVPLSKALDQLTKGEKPVFQKVIQQVADDISAGLTLSDAIARHPGAFNPMFVAVVHSGEVAGALDRVLDGLANYMESVEIMRGKVKTAMRYPIFIFGFVSVMMAGILWKLVPTFESIYTGLRADLPWPTELLIQTSALFRHQFIFVVALGIALFIGYKALMTQEKFKIKMQKYLLHVPIFGGILQKNIWATYCRTMSLLMGAGTPILKATEIAGSAVNNSFFSKGLEQVYANLRKGDQLSDAMEASGLFPVLVVQLAATGETSGQGGCASGKSGGVLRTGNEEHCGLPLPDHRTGFDRGPGRNRRRDSDSPVSAHFQHWEIHPMTRRANARKTNLVAIHSHSFRIKGETMSHSKIVRKGQQGFTLVEVIVVAVIVAILAGVSIPLYLGYINGTRENAAANAAGSAASFMAACVNQGGVPALPAMPGNGANPITCTIGGVLSTAVLVVPDQVTLTVVGGNTITGIHTAGGGASQPYTFNTAVAPPAGP